MPPMMPVPIEWRALAPAPVAIAMGTVPKMKASEVMMIGRRRSSPASIAASVTLRPSFSLATANSTMRMPFLAARPTISSRPIWK